MNLIYCLIKSVFGENIFQQAVKIKLKFVAYFGKVISDLRRRFPAGVEKVARNMLNQK